MNNPPTNPEAPYNYKNGTNQNIEFIGAPGQSIGFSCSPDLTAGLLGNISLPPLFVREQQGDWRLRSTSPCANTGTNLTWMSSGVDLDGNQRIQMKTVDMGAYESPPPTAGILIQII